MAGGTALLLSACGILDLPLCTTSFEPAIIVEIREAGTGAPLAAGARGAVRDGGYVDSLRPAESTSGDTATMYSRQAAGERAGTYAVEVRRTGYQTWTANGVRVTKGECHVNTRRLIAALQPAS